MRQEDVHWISVAIEQPWIPTYSLRCVIARCLPASASRPGRLRKSVRPGPNCLVAVCSECFGLTQGQHHLLVRVLAEVLGSLPLL